MPLQRGGVSLKSVQRRLQFAYYKQYRFYTSVLCRSHLESSPTELRIMRSTTACIQETSENFFKIFFRLRSVPSWSYDSVMHHRSNVGCALEKPQLQLQLHLTTSKSI